MQPFDTAVALFLDLWGRNKRMMSGVFRSMHAVRLTSVILMLGAVVVFGSAQPMLPTRVVSLHYPCMALVARVETKIRVHCTVADDGSCSAASVVYGHPLFGKEAIENAKKWKFPVLKGGSRPRTADIDYQFRIRGMRNPEQNADVDVTFELPNVVIVTAPFDAKVPCRWPPME